MSGRSRGNRSIYSGKTTRVQGVITPRGAKDFESARRELAALVGVKANAVSDGDTIEFLARSFMSADHIPAPAWAAKR